jgi:IclR family transcriptional regulator, pca regulon regulatory protein
MSSEVSKNSIKSSDFIQSLERGLSVIQAFSPEYPDLTVSEAAQITNLSRPAVRRILLTLEELGFIHSINGRYMLTARVLSLGYSYISSRNIWNFTHPHMRKLVEQTEESTSVSVLDHTDIVYVARIPTKSIMTIALDIGSRLPAYATSMGLVLLANLSSEELEEYLDSVELKAFTTKTIVDKDELKKRLVEIRKEGWASSKQQLEDGLHSIAAPIKNNDGKVIAAINISAHAGRFTEANIEEFYVPLLLETANEISEDISKSYQISQL